MIIERPLGYRGARGTAKPVTAQQEIVEKPPASTAQVAFGVLPKGGKCGILLKM